MKVEVKTNWSLSAWCMYCIITHNTPNGKSFWRTLSTRRVPSTQHILPHSLHHDNTSVAYAIFCLNYLVKTARPDAMDVGFLMQQFGSDMCLVLSAYYTTVWICQNFSKVN